MQCPRTCHLDVAYRVLRYIKGTIGTGIFLLSSTTLHIHGYTDSDWVGCPVTQYFTIGYFTTLGNSPIL